MTSGKALEKKKRKVGKRKELISLIYYIYYFVLLRNTHKNPIYNHLAQGQLVILISNSLIAKSILP
jgi:hypothetical protein